jgi:hypothetical protein
MIDMLRLKYQEWKLRRLPILNPTEYSIDVRFNGATFSATGIWDENQSPYVFDLVRVLYPTGWVPMRVHNITATSNGALVWSAVDDKSYIERNTYKP